jgi:hypothetical protein
LWEINADGSGLTHLLGTGPGGFFGGLPGELPAWGTSTVRPRIDLTPPNIELRTPTEGVVYDMGGNSTVDYVCTDDLSGVASCEGTRPSGGSLDTGHAGAYSFQVTATDRAGNVSSKKVTYTVADRTPPTITITTPSAGGAYVLGATVSADYQCADEPGGSGMIACQATPIDTTSIGAKTFTVTASDNAGNTATASSSYAVIYAFAGFYSPTALYPAATSANAGQSVKLRFSLHGGQGLDVLAAGSPVWTPCSGGDTATATGTLSYQPTLDRYAYEVSTPKTWAGTCRDLVVTLRDSTVHKARFQFDK